MEDARKARIAGAAARLPEAALWLLMLLALLRFETFLHIGSAFLGGYERDAGLYVWLIRLAERDPLRMLSFETPAFFPYGLSLAWSDNFILPSVLAAPLLRLGLPLALVYNLFLLGAGYLNGLLTYRLAALLGAEFFPALFAAAGFMSCGPLSAQLGHPQMQFFFFVPLAAIFAVHFARTARVTDAAACGLALAMCFYTTVYYAVFGAIVVALMMAFRLRRREVSCTPAALAKFGIGMAIGLSPATWALPAYLSTKDAFGGRALYEAFYLSADALSYLAASPFSFLYSATAGLSQPETPFFCGITLYALFTAALWLRILKSETSLATAVFVIGLLLLFAFSLCAPLLQDTRPYARYAAAVCGWFPIVYLVTVGGGEAEPRFPEALFLLGVFLSLSFGPLGNPEKNQLPLGLFTLFHAAFPGVSAIRAASRFGIVAIFFLFVAVSLSKPLWEKLSARPLRLLLLLLLVAENYPARYPLEEARPAPEALSSAALAQEITVFLPFAGRLKDGQVESWSDFAQLNVDYMNFALARLERIVNGYSGQRSKLMLEYPRELAGFPDLRSIRALSAIHGLRQVVFDGRFVPGFDASTFEAALAKFSENLEVTARAGDGSYILKFRPIARPEGLLLLYPNGQRRNLSIAVSAASDAEARELSKALSLDGEAIANVPFQSGHDSTTFLLPLPADSPRVRPYRLRADLPPGALLDLH